jgi:hypothetical protein
VALEHPGACPKLHSTQGACSDRKVSEILMLTASAFLWGFAVVLALCTIQACLTFNTTCSEMEGWGAIMKCSQIPCEKVLKNPVR